MSDSYEIRFLRCMADEGHNDARHTLGMRYMEGRGVVQSDFLALKYLKSINDDLGPTVHRMIGEILTRDRGVPPNKHLARRHFGAAFEQYFWLLESRPMTITMTRLGHMYEHGQGIEQNLEAAFHYYMESARRGDIEGLCKVVHFYEYGDSGEPDAGRATLWRSRMNEVLEMAEAGDAELQFQIGARLGAARAIPPDYPQSAYWYKKAAAKDNTVAQRSLGSLYEFGVGVTKDHRMAMYWYRDAMNSGDEESRYRVAVLNLNRGSSENDIEEAKDVLFCWDWKCYTLGCLLSEWVMDGL